MDLCLNSEQIRESLCRRCEIIMESNFVTMQKIISLPLRTLLTRVLHVELRVMIRCPYLMDS